MYYISENTPKICKLVIVFISFPSPQFPLSVNYSLLPSHNSFKLSVLFCGFFLCSIRKTENANLSSKLKSNKACKLILIKLSKLDLLFTC